MTAYNLIRFKFNCAKCGGRHHGLASCRSSASFGGTVRNKGLYDIEYKIGDTMDWFDEKEFKDTWPSDYSFVSNLKSSSIYVIEGCYGKCLNCGSEYTFYFYIKDRQIMRIIGYEDFNLNYNSIVASD